MTDTWLAGATVQHHSSFYQQNGTLWVMEPVNFAMASKSAIEKQAYYAAKMFDDLRLGPRKAEPIALAQASARVSQSCTFSTGRFAPSRSQRARKRWLDWLAECPIAIKTGEAARERWKQREGQYFERRRTASRPNQFIDHELAGALRAHLTAKTPAAMLFNTPDRTKPAKMLRADLTAARDAWLAEAKRDPEELTRRQQIDFLAAAERSGRMVRLSFAPAHLRSVAVPHGLASQDGANGHARIARRC